MVSFHLHIQKHFPPDQWTKSGNLINNTQHLKPNLSILEFPFNSVLFHFSKFNPPQMKRNGYRHPCNHFLEIENGMNWTDISVKGNPNIKISNPSRSTPLAMYLV